MRLFVPLSLALALAGTAAGQDTIWTRLSGQGDLSRAVSARSVGTDVFVSGVDRDSALGRSIVFVVRYDGDGNQMWDRKCELAPYETGGLLAVGPDGQPYTSIATGRSNPTSVLVKLSIVGDTAWTRPLPGIRLGPLAVDLSNNAFILAQRNLPMPDDTLLLLGYTPAGAEMLHAGIQLPGVEKLAGLCRTSAGNFIAAFSTGGPVPKALLAKFTGDGTPIWTVSLPESAGPTPLAVADRGSEECYALAQGARGVTLLAIGPDGAALWSQPVVGSGVAQDIAVDQYSNAFVTSGGTDCRVDKFGPAGNLLASLKGGSPVSDLPAGLTVGQDGNPVIVATALDTSGTSQVLTVKLLSNPVGMAGLGRSSQGIRLLGSITSGSSIEFEIGRPGRYRVDVFDAHGRSAGGRTVLVAAGRQKFELPQLPTGVYLVEVVGPECSRHKLIISRSGRSK